MKNMAVICRSRFSSKSRLAQLHKFLLQKRALERCSACYKIEFAINCACHWRHTFSSLRRLKKYLEETMNMKQDRRLHVKNLIMNDPETVKVTSKETAFCSTQLCKRHSGKFEYRYMYTLGVVYDESPTFPAGPLRLRMLHCVWTGS